MDIGILNYALRVNSSLRSIGLFGGSWALQDSLGLSLGLILRGRGFRG